MQAFDSARYPQGSRGELDSAWLGIYQTLWWFEHGVLHIREANDLRKLIWRERAAMIESYIADELDIPVERLSRHFDRMMRLPRWRGMQRNNPLGNGLRILVKELLTRHGSESLTYSEEVQASLWFPGIELPGRSRDPKMDVGAISGASRQPVAVISCKWSFRHDRVSDPTNEAVQYKVASLQQQRMHLRYFVVTNELNTQRLDKILDQPAVDALVHVHLPAVHLLSDESASMQIARAEGRLLDLSDFVRSSATWDMPASRRRVG